MKHLALATAGHVDHGKSALVQALTGTDPDRLPEEKARGITIDLGFAELTLHDPATGEAIHLGLVDVPGHEDFVKNMVAGVGAVDLALLAIAADDGWMPQTEEHLQILIHLGVRHLVVALTKSDLVESTAPAASAVRERLQETDFAEAPIVPTALADPRTLQQLRKALADVSARLPERRADGPPRLAVDRAFSLRGVGTIATGTLAGGPLRRGESVVVQPAGFAARIRTIQTHGREAEEAVPGQRVAVSLPDMPVAAGHATEGLRRGDVITIASGATAHRYWDVLLTCSPRGAAPVALLRAGRQVTVHHGSGSVAARVRLLGTARLHAGESSLARLRFARPMFGLVGDRLVLRDPSGQRTLAGGVVLDATPPVALGAAQRALLQGRRESLETPDLITTELVRQHSVHLPSLVANFGGSRQEIAATLEALTSAGRVVLRGERAVDAPWWMAQQEKILAAIDATHRQHPEQAGLELSDARALLPKVPAELIAPLVAELEAADIVRHGTALARAAHRPALPPHLQQAGARLRAALAAQPLDPPARSQLAPDALSGQALRFLLAAGEAMEVSSDLVMDRAAFERAQATVVQFLKAHASGTVSELRQALGASRRIVVPLLEKLDRAGVTRRLGDRRVLKT